MVYFLPFILSFLLLFLLLVGAVLPPRSPVTPGPRAGTQCLPRGHEPQTPGFGGEQNSLPAHSVPGEQKRV